MKLEKLPPPALPGWLSELLPFERYRVATGDWKVDVMEHGRGRPVVTLHGNPSWGFLYRKVAQALAGAPLRVIMPDLLGLGLSDKPRDAAVHTLDQHAELIGRLADLLELDDFVI